MRRRGFLRHAATALAVGVGFDARGRPPPRRARLVLDAGHGAPGNTGTVAAGCGREQDETLRLQDALSTHLLLSGTVAVRTTRRGTEAPTYQERRAAFEGWPADAVVGIHQDARAADGWFRGDDGCLFSRGGEGFAVLFSDEGAPALVARRRALARALGAALLERGFAAYDGADYAGLYSAHAPGVFIDRHVPGERIMMLRRTRVPYVILETSQATNLDEAARWRDPDTLKRCAAALEAATLTFAAASGPKP